MIFWTALTQVAGKNNKKGFSAQTDKELVLRKTNEVINSFGTPIFQDARYRNYYQQIIIIIVWPTLVQAIIYKQ